ncbi:hypothetical protein ABEB36_009791 [Hypothenemus hampei]|uniref:Thioredoxin domain-containing protein n=1 Tax=Hypothenemus hampei TaxID=57062 RepID=A0ABD1EI06_HYPHA
MSWLRKCLVKSEKSGPKRSDSDDKNEPDPRKSVDFKGNNQNQQFRENVNEFTYKMLNLIRELLIFCLILMVYSAITNEMNDLSFIMFYAPWDAESQFARNEFLIAADEMKDYVVFAAVNCWHPASDCRTQYSKVYNFRWPVLIAYPSYGRGIQYNGPISAHYISRFLYKLMKPVERLINETVLNFDEAFVVAELNTLPGSIEYSVYYSVALKYLEVDYAGRITFFVKPVKYTQNKISLYLWDQVKEFIVELNNWKIEPILQWIIKNSESPSSWVTPAGSKSLVLSDLLQPGPFLILFTPRNPYHTANDYYMMLQEIAQEYRNCENRTINFDMNSKRLKHRFEYEELKKLCKTKGISSKKVFSVATVTPFFNSTLTTHINCEPQTCHVYNDMEECVVNGKMQLQTSMWTQESDFKSMENLKKFFHKEWCKRFRTSEKLSETNFVPKDPPDYKPLSFSTLSCTNPNTSLNFIALDSIRDEVFAQRLGIDISTKFHRTAAVIVNEQMETHYILEEPVTNRNLRNFIQRFMNDSLPRSMESNIDLILKNPSSYGFKQNNQSNETIFVEELTHRNFLDSVLQKNKAVVVLYYSKQCSYCNGISFVFLTVARKLSFVDNIIFKRIDGDLNILPWEYTMEEFPTVLLFPSIQKEESRVFPSDIPITVPNLMGFILSNVDTSTKLHVMYSVCLHNDLEKNRESCLSRLRNETLWLIQKTLRDWRQSNNRHRQVVLHNLTQLRQLQFLFNHSPKEIFKIKSYFKRIKIHQADDYTMNLSDNTLLKDEL